MKAKLRTDFICECGWAMTEDKGYLICLNVSCPEYQVKYSYPKIELKRAFLGVEAEQIIVDEA